MSEATMLWLDFETDGLEDDCGILEVAAVLTDDDLIELARYVTLLAPPADLSERLEANRVVKTMHEDSELLAELASADGALPDTGTVDRELAALIAAHCPGQVCLAGSGVANFDRKVIAAQMPATDSRLTYWSIDVGVERRHFHKATGVDLVTPEGPIAHRAEADIDRSLREGRAFHEFFRACGATDDIRGIPNTGGGW